MAKKESIQKRLESVRPPRVQLTYDVEIGDAIERKEIPFVVGVLADFTGKGDPDKPLPKLKDRRFVNVDVDTFDDVMKGVAPKASFRVPNKLTGEGGEFAVNLAFDRLEDFRPESVVQQVEPLRRLIEARTRLAELRNKMAGNDRLQDLLRDVLADGGKLAAIGHEAQGDGQ